MEDFGDHKIEKREVDCKGAKRIVFCLTNPNGRLILAMWDEIDSARAVAVIKQTKEAGSRPFT